jgi:hypothetical protein
MLAQAPGTIDLGKFRVVYEEERELPLTVRQPIFFNSGRLFA